MVKAALGDVNSIIQTAGEQQKEGLSRPRRASFSGGAPPALK
jgi:hypothetical protein